MQPDFNNSADLYFGFNVPFGGVAVAFRLSKLDAEVLPI
jgi:hypothetical protein